MKKLLLSLLVLATANVFAVSYSAKATMTLKSSDNKTCEVVIAQSAELNEGYNNGYCGEMNMSGREVAFYAISNATPYQTWGTKVLGELPFGLKTNSSTSYTISVSSVSGTEQLYLIDLLTNIITPLTNGGSYAFTATANATDDTRFKLVKPDFKVCVTFDQVEIYFNPSLDNIVVTNMAGETVVNVAPTGDLQVIDMSDKPSGHYVLTVNGTQYEFCNKPQPKE